MELHSARALQAAILPSKEELKEVRERSGLDIASYLDTSSEIGGDFWGMKKLFPHQAALWMVDFSGHGVAAALNAFRFQTYLKEPSPLAVKPGEYLSLLNEKLLQILLRGHFATMFYGIVDTHGNMLHYACACSPNPLILRKDGTVEKLDGCGTPLGICTQTYSTQSVRFDYGDTLVLYSDALIETPKNHNSYITEEQMMELLAAHKGASARQLKEAMLEYFASHTDAPLYDDLTLCLCRRMD